MRKLLLLLFTAVAFSAFAQHANRNIITEVPAGGIYSNANRSGCGFFYSPFSGQELGQFTCTLGDLVTMDDGSIYVKNPFSQRQTGTYIKLEKESEGKYVAHLPQAISVEDNDTTYAMRMVVKIVGEKFTYIPDTLEDNTIKTDVEFTLRNDSLIQTSDGRNAQGLPYAILGEADAKGRWKGFGDDEVIYSVINEEPLSPSESADIQTYQMSIKNSLGEIEHTTIKVAFEGNHVFLRLPYAKNQWAYGTIDGTTAIFKKHYMGRNEAESCHQYFVPCKYTNEEYTMMDEMPLSFNTITKELVAKEGYAMVINAGKQDVGMNNRLATYNAPILTLFIEKPATPANPFINSVFKDETGWDLGSIITFSIKAEDINGNYITQEKLYYRVYRDTPDSPYPFYIDGKEVTDIPSTYTNSESFFIQDGMNYIIVHFVGDFTKIGIQEVYKGGEETHTSDIIWYDTSTAGIESATNSKTVKNVNYYTLSGTQVSHPAHGTFIQVTTFEDGTKRAIKLIKK